jgi:hypothetical protein
MDLAANVFDVWVFRRTDHGVEYLLLYTSQDKADRYFNGGRFWQIPSNSIQAGESVVAAVDRLLGHFRLTASAVWAAEHVYAIYNRRFACMQLIAVYAAEVDADDVRLDPDESSEFRWCAFEDALAMVHYRGLKDGLRSVREYVTGGGNPAPELRLL